MDGTQLLRLGKHLVNLSHDHVREPDDPPLTPAERAVLSVVLSDPDRTVGELVQLTGFVQSHISASVARLRDRGWLHTAPDPADGRRTLVRPADGVVRGVARRAAYSIDDTLAAALGDTAAAQRAVALLTELNALLLPDTASVD